MNFKGGVLIVASLLWDREPKREKWRRACLKDLSTKQSISLPIRYGKVSRSRNDTYTMILSNHLTTLPGRGYPIEFREAIKNFKMLSSQAFALASTEGLWKCTGPSLNKSWGTVGLLLNPNIDRKNKSGADLIRIRWKEIYQSYEGQFIVEDYKIENEPPIIDSDGFLQIKWTKEMNTYDFLIATPVVPFKHPLDASDIAKKMIEKNYSYYFEQNVANGIQTFQDKEISEYLDLHR